MLLSSLLQLSSSPISGAIVGFSRTNYTGEEGEEVEVCVTIHSPNETILQNNAVEGIFTITGSSGEFLRVN